VDSDLAWEAEGTVFVAEVETELCLADKSALLTSHRARPGRIDGSSRSVLETWRWPRSPFNNCQSHYPPARWRLNLL